MNDVVIDVQSVTKRFDSKVVIDNLNYQLRRGTVTGLLGKNGAGKTTLLKCALGLQTPQEGEISVFGEPSGELSGNAKARLAYVPQEVSLYPWMKLRQIIAYTRAFYPRWNDQLINRLANEWELPLEDRVGTLSLGQAQKLAIVMALGHEPELLVLDEPAASLDPEARRQFLAALLEVAMDSDRTILFSTHITSDIERIADQVAVLRSGKIIYDDDLSALKDSVKRIRVSSLSESVAGELESIPGLLSCQRDGSDAVFCVSGFHGELADRLQTDLGTDVAVEDLNLEEIFLELHQSDELPVFESVGVAS